MPKSSSAPNQGKHIENVPKTDAQDHRETTSGQSGVPKESAIAKETQETKERERVVRMKYLRSLFANTDQYDESFDLSDFELEMPKTEHTTKEGTLTGSA
ncbi:hypothetical protein QVD17_15852 [Tagetes erecta]|uniref:Uncharacterized protein n=1 Tax=Tagetes erecta TaxID=13708 RepID=A0AAD8KPY2_TARER|nr:hypothetical protein QVD17_15852 [Tagetes erecta]